METERERSQTTKISDLAKHSTITPKSFVSVIPLPSPTQNRNSTFNGKKMFEKKIHNKGKDLLMDHSIGSQFQFRSQPWPMYEELL